MQQEAVSTDVSSRENGHSRQMIIVDTEQLQAIFKAVLVSSRTTMRKLANENEAPKSTLHDSHKQKAAVRRRAI